jgi:hypothetical protein
LDNVGDFHTKRREDINTDWVPRRPLDETSTVTALTPPKTGSTTRATDGLSLSPSEFALRAIAFPLMRIELAGLHGPFQNATRGGATTPTGCTAIAAG